MATTETPGSIVLRCNVGWEDVREVMAKSRILTLMRATRKARTCAGSSRNKAPAVARRTPGSGT
jgi:hypothetical protein